MKTRSTINAKCSRCGQLSFLLRLRGRFVGLVQDHSHPDLRKPTLQLPRKADGSYTLDGFRCWRCREPVCETCHGAGGPSAGDADSDGSFCRGCGQ